MRQTRLLTPAQPLVTSLPGVRNKAELGILVAPSRTNSSVSALFIVTISSLCDRNQSEMVIGQCAGFADHEIGNDQSGRASKGSFSADDFQNRRPPPGGSFCGKDQMAVADGADVEPVIIAVKYDRSRFLERGQTGECHLQVEGSHVARFGD